MNQNKNGGPESWNGGWQQNDREPMWADAGRSTPLEPGKGSSRGEYPVDIRAGMKTNAARSGERSSKERPKKKGEDQQHKAQAA